MYFSQQYYVVFNTKQLFLSSVYVGALIRHFWSFSIYMNQNTLSIKVHTVKLL